MEALIFYSLAAVMVISSLMVILRKNPVHSALFLILTFLCLAGLFLQLNAQFIAAVQVIVYAGAIMVLFLFVIMLLNVEREIPLPHLTRLQLQATPPQSLAGLRLPDPEVESRLLGKPAHEVHVTDSLA